MNIPVWSQRDGLWSNQRLGTVDGTTIGQFGCLLTCISMLNAAFDPEDPWTPAQVDNVFTDNGGYANGNLVIWTRITKLLPNSGYLGADWTPDSPAPIDKIKGHLDGAGLVICQVGFGGDPSKMHFVLAVGHDGNQDLVIHDPWYGDQVLLGASNRYGQPAASAIIASHYFIDLIPSQPKPEPIAPPPPSPVANRAIEIPAEIPPVAPVEPAIFETPVVAPVAPEIGSVLDNLPEYETNYHDQPHKAITNKDTPAIDLVTDAVLLTIPANTPFDVAGTMTKDGVLYVRSVWAKEHGLWNGVAANDLSDTPIPVTVEINPAPESTAPTQPIDGVQKPEENPLGAPLEPEKPPVDRMAQIGGLFWVIVRLLGRVTLALTKKKGE